MVVTTAIVLLPLYSAFSAQAVQEVRQDISLEGRISQLQQEVRADPRNPDLHFELSKLYEEDVERYYDESLSEFCLAVDRGLKEKGYNILNRSVTRKNNKGVSLFERGKYDEAIEMFESALEEDLNNPYTYANLCSAYGSKGEFEKAIEYIRKAVDLDPTNVALHMTMGVTCIKKGDLELALLNYNKIEHIDPKYNRQYFGVATAYRGLGQYENAIGALDRLSESAKEIPQIIELRQECVRLLNN